MGTEIAEVEEEGGEKTHRERYEDETERKTDRTGGAFQAFTAAISISISFSVFWRGPQGATQGQFNVSRMVGVQEHLIHLSIPLQLSTPASFSFFCMYIIV